MQSLSLFAVRGIELLSIHSVHGHSGMTFTLILFRVLLFCFSFRGLLSTNQTHFLVTYIYRIFKLAPVLWRQRKTHLGFVGQASIKALESFPFCLKVAKI